MVHPTSPILFPMNTDMKHPRLGIAICWLILCSRIGAIDTTIMGTRLKGWFAPHCSSRASHSPIQYHSMHFSGSFYTGCADDVPVSVASYIIKALYVSLNNYYCRLFVIHSPSVSWNGNSSVCCSYFLFSDHFISRIFSMCLNINS